MYVSATDEIFFASNGGGALSYSGLNQSNQYSKISLKDAEATNGTVDYTKVRMLSVSGNHPNLNHYTASALRRIANDERRDAA